MCTVIGRGLVKDLEETIEELTRKDQSFVPREKEEKVSSFSLSFSDSTGQSNVIQVRNCSHIGKDVREEIVKRVFDRLIEMDGGNGEG